MNVADSSGWLEYFADGPNASWFASVIEDSGTLVVPTLSIYEVFKRVLQQRGQTDAALAVAAMRRGRIVDLDADLAQEAAGLSLALKLPMADSVILATARAFEATLWTQDADFAGIPGVNYRPKAAVEQAP